MNDDELEFLGKLLVELCVGECPMTLTALENRGWIPFMEIPAWEPVEGCMEKCPLGKYDIVTDVWPDEGDCWKQFIKETYATWKKEGGRK